MDAHSLSLATLAFRPLKDTLLAEEEETAVAVWKAEGATTAEELTTAIVNIGRAPR